MRETAEIMDEHLIALLKWLLDEVRSSGGDGDAFWLTKHYTIDSLYYLVDNYLNSIGNTYWTLEQTTKDDFMVWRNQEALIVSQDTEYELPSWAQCVITL